MSSVQRRARAKENLRRAILDAARELFVTEDYRAISMRRIAEKIEYSPTAIYLHFKDKQEILFQLVWEGFELLNARLEALDIADPVERLRQGGQAYVEFAQTHPHYYKLMFQLEDKALIAQCATCFEISESAFGFIVRCVTEAMAQGKFRTDADPMIVAHTIWAHIHGAVSLMLAGRLMRLPEEAHSTFYSHVMETTLRGLRVDT